MRALRRIGLLALGAVLVAASLGECAWQGEEPTPVVGGAGGAGGVGELPEGRAGTMFAPTNSPLPIPTPIATQKVAPPIIPRELELCKVDSVKVRAAGPTEPVPDPAAAGGGGTADAANAATAEGGAAGSFVSLGASASSAPSPMSALLQHVAYYTGWADLTEENGQARARLARSENLEFKRVSGHYFSCVDARSEYAVLGTPGGDMGEFINALSAMEKQNGRPYDLVEVNMLFQDYLRIMSTRGRRFFYYNSDGPSMEALNKAAGLEDVLDRNIDAKKRNAVLELVYKPEHVGNPHIKGMLTEPAAYGVRKELAEWLIKIFFSVYYDDNNPIRDRLLFVVLRGPPVKGTAYARIWSPDQCPGMAPLVVPNVADGGATRPDLPILATDAMAARMRGAGPAARGTPTEEAAAKEGGGGGDAAGGSDGGDRMVVSHEAHVEFFRQDLARFFAFKNGMIEITLLFEEIMKIGRMQLETKMSVFTDAPKTDVIFHSSWDRWPF